MVSSASGPNWKLMVLSASKRIFMLPTSVSMEGVLPMSSARDAALVIAIASPMRSVAMVVAAGAECMAAGGGMAEEGHSRYCRAVLMARMWGSDHEFRDWGWNFHRAFDSGLAGEDSAPG